jgi:hypothetical protein
MSIAGGEIIAAQQEGSWMNDKISTQNSAPVSTPAKEAPAATQVAQPLKADDNKPAGEPVIKPPSNG